MQCGNAQPVTTIIVQVGIIARFAWKNASPSRHRAQSKTSLKARNNTVTNSDSEAIAIQPNRLFARWAYQTISSTVIGKWSEYPSRSAPPFTEGRLNLRGLPLDAFNTAGLNMATLSSFALTGLAVRNMP